MQKGQDGTPEDFVQERLSGVVRGELAAAREAGTVSRHVPNDNVDVDWHWAGPGFRERLPHHVAVSAMVEAAENRKQVPLVYWKGSQRVVVGKATVTPDGIIAEVSPELRGDVAQLFEAHNLNGLSMSFAYPPVDKPDFIFKLPEPDLGGFEKRFNPLSSADNPFAKPRELPDDPALD